MIRQMHKWLLNANTSDEDILVILEMVSKELSTRSKLRRLDHKSWGEYVLSVRNPRR